MAIYNAERYIADFIKTIIEDGLDEGQDVCHLSDSAFIEEEDGKDVIITRPPMEEAKDANKSIIAAMLADYLYEVFISSYQKYLKLEEDSKEIEEKKSKRLEKSPMFIKGKEDGASCSPPIHTDASDYVKGYYEGVSYRESLFNDGSKK